LLPPLERLRNQVVAVDIHPSERTPAQRARSRDDGRRGGWFGQEGVSARHAVHIEAAARI
jgi:hypothetical protein